MIVCHVLEGRTRVPAPQWGPLEAWIWDMRHWCERLGHSFYIINDRVGDEVLRDLQEIKPDVLHVHAERHFRLAETSSATVRNVQIHSPAFLRSEHQTILREVLRGTMAVCCASHAVRETFAARGVARERLRVLPVGTRTECVRFSPHPHSPGRAICAARIHDRKRQHLLAGVEEVYFAGPITCGIAGDSQPRLFGRDHPRYLGDWSHDVLRDQLTNYATYVLLSDYEISQGVIPDALAAGLGLVLSENAAGHLPCHPPVLDIVPETRIHDEGYLTAVIRSNARRAEMRRSAIRAFAEACCDWGLIVQTYLDQARLELLRSEVTPLHTAP